MSNYKFNIGDKVRILKMDEWSYKESMEDDVDRIGVIIDRDDEENINGYSVRVIEDFLGFGFWYMEDSLELVKLEKEDNNYKEETVNKDDVLSILYETKESEVINRGTICDLIRRVSELPCK